METIFHEMHERLYNFRIVSVHAILHEAVELIERDIICFPRCDSISLILPGKCFFMAVSGASWSRACRASSCSRKDSCKSFSGGSPAH